MMKNKGFKVPPLSRSIIKNIADEVRDYLHPSQNICVDIVKILEFTLPKILPEFTLEVCDDETMQDDHGRTYPAKNLIQIREDVYINACNGNGRDRFTLAHELGHLIIHPNIPLARTPLYQSQKAFEDSEWQANTFASEFLMPEKHVIRCKSLDEIIEKFNVSETAARVRLDVLSRSRR